RPSEIPSWLQQMNLQKNYFSDFFQAITNVWLHVCLRLGFDNERIKTGAIYFRRNKLRQSAGFRHSTVVKRAQ
ncbi:MAG: hypothetical protein MUE54_15775, partial [Anaerolineae bacterium]|nr:hypothetical protein [Anaerolineae bacterium]